ncbi:MAG: hypothetical protein WCK55_16995 [Verrucomicrobiota bacterium]
MTRPLLRLATICIVAAAPMVVADDFLDRVDELLTFSLAGGKVKARLSGALDLEAYSFSQPPPGLIFTDRYSYFNPRLSIFLDVQLGPHVYLFAQGRWDKGFDPGAAESRAALDEYAIRFTPWDDGRVSVQFGKFATVFGNWASHHDSWGSPFITAPLPYENLTGIWSNDVPEGLDELMFWGAVGGYEAGNSRADTLALRRLRLPVIWGPSYTTGAAIFAHAGKFDFAAELKNASLSSRPKDWDVGAEAWNRPTFSSRIGYRPNASWNFGVSGSVGCYLNNDAAGKTAPGHSLSDYRQIVLGQDISFAWHHWELGAEVFESRFEIPEIGNADSLAYYIEAKYKFTPQLFGAVRWNQHLFGTIANEEGGFDKWGGDIWRTDVALGYRFTAHTQLKFQYSIERRQADISGFGHMFAGQFTIRF